MAKLLIALAAFGLSQCQRMEGVTPYELEHLDDLKIAAGFGDAQHRGPNWYSMSSEESETSPEHFSSESTSSASTESRSRSETESASSIESSEEKRATRVYRTCTPCAHDMLKKHTNLGIKWICGAYQRARRTFKSECMMRFRNCQDGTMFVKVSDARCKNDTYHGRHWFYIYKV
ncbi:unnamed protein product, partial [Iphiclides podalirius]